MIATARQVYELIQGAAITPPGWCAADWRSDVVLGSGLTALGVEAALLDLGIAAPRVLGDPGKLRKIHPDGRGILGCSFSGRSAEVMDGLAQLQARGFPTCLVGGHPESGVRLPGPHVPRAWQHAAYAAALPALLQPDQALPSAGERPSPRPFFRSAYQHGLTPIFVVADHHFTCRLWRSYWIELLGRPAFQLSHPEWSHDFFWSVVRSPGPYAFIVSQPETDLSDGRMQKIITWIQQNGHPLLLLPPANGSAVAELLASADDFQTLAAEFGIDLSADLELSPQGEVYSQP